MNNTLPLNIKIDPIEFLYAELPNSFNNPFARVRYAIDGQPQDDGLRLDLGKRVFIDHLDVEQYENILQAATPEIVKITYNFYLQSGW